MNLREKRIYDTKFKGQLYYIYPNKINQNKYNKLSVNYG